jgi:hypothetical protein
MKGGSVAVPRRCGGAVGRRWLTAAADRAWPARPGRGRACSGARAGKAPPCRGSGLARSWRGAGRNGRGDCAAGLPLSRRGPRSHVPWHSFSYRRPGACRPPDLWSRPHAPRFIAVIVWPVCLRNGRCFRVAPDELAISVSRCLPAGTRACPLPPPPLHQRRISPKQRVLLRSRRSRLAEQRFRTGQ